MADPRREERRGDSQDRWHSDYRRDREGERRRRRVGENYGSRRWTQGMSGERERYDVDRNERADREGRSYRDREPRWEDRSQNDNSSNSRYDSGRRMPRKRGAPDEAYDLDNFKEPAPLINNKALSDARQRTRHLRALRKEEQPPKTAKKPQPMQVTTTRRNDEARTSDGDVRQLSARTLSVSGTKNKTSAVSNEDWGNRMYREASGTFLIGYEASDLDLDPVLAFTRLVYDQDCDDQMIKELQRICLCGGTLEGWLVCPEQARETFTASLKALNEGSQSMSLLSYGNDQKRRSSLSADVIDEMLFDSKTIQYVKTRTAVNRSPDDWVPEMLVLTSLQIYFVCGGIISLESFVSTFVEFTHGRFFSDPFAMLLIVTLITSFRDDSRFKMVEGSKSVSKQKLRLVYVTDRITKRLSSFDLRTEEGRPAAGLALVKSLRSAIRDALQTEAEAVEKLPSCYLQRSSDGVIDEELRIVFDGSWEPRLGPKPPGWHSGIDSRQDKRRSSLARRPTTGKGIAALWNSVPAALSTEGRTVGGDFVIRPLTRIQSIKIQEELVNREEVWHNSWVGNVIATGYLGQGTHLEGYCPDLIATLKTNMERVRLLYEKDTYDSPDGKKFQKFRDITVEGERNTQQDPLALVFCLVYFTGWCSMVHVAAVAGNTPKIIADIMSAEHDDGVARHKRAIDMIERAEAFCAAVSCLARWPELLGTDMTSLAERISINDVQADQKTAAQLLRGQKEWAAEVLGGTRPGYEVTWSFEEFLLVARDPNSMLPWIMSLGMAGEWVGSHIFADHRTRELGMRLSEAANFCLDSIDSVFGAKGKVSFRRRTDLAIASACRDRVDDWDEMLEAPPVEIRELNFEKSTDCWIDAEAVRPNSSDVDIIRGAKRNSPGVSLFME